MSTDNPYRSPERAAPGVPAPDPGVGVLIKSVGVVLATTAAGGVLGLGIGAALGAAVPGYYRSVFPRGGEPDFDPVAVGVGLGLSQGALFGAAIGVALVALYYWYRLRVMRLNTIRK